MLNARLRHDAEGQQVRLRPVRARGHRGPARPTAAATTTGSRSSWWRRTPRATRTSRSRRCSRTARAGQVVPRQTRRSSAVARSFVDIGKARLASTACGRSRRRRCAPVPRPRAAARSRPRRAALAGARLHWRRLPVDVRPTHWMMTARGRALLRDAAQDAVARRPTQMRELQDEKLRRLVRHAYRNVPYYRDAHAGARLAPRRHPRPRRSAQAAVPDEGRRAQAPLLRHHVSDNHDKARGPQGHHLRLDGRAVRLLRRPRAARVPLGGDAARAGVDRLPLRRSAACACGTRRSA